MNVLSDLSLQLSTIDDFIKRGEIKKAQVAITAIVVGADVRREERLRLANLARRSGMVFYSLKLLRKLVKSDQELSVTSQAEEIIAYCAGLSLIGATKEAQEKLSLIDGHKYPEAWLHQAFLFISQWEYRQAIYFLRCYAKHPNLSEYQKTVAQVNLLACYLYCEKNKMFLRLSNSLILFCKKRSYHLLLGNILEMQAQYYILADKIQIALEVLSQAQSYIQSEESAYSLLIEKWQFIAKIKQQQISTQNKTQVRRPSNKDLLQIQEKWCNAVLTDSVNSLDNEYLRLIDKAERMNSYETKRDLDFYYAILKNSDQSLNQVYWGTSLKSYKNRILFATQGQFQPATEFTLSAGQATSVFDLWRCRLDEKYLPLKVGGRTWQVLYILSQDLYRPVRVGELFTKLFPNESFDIELSMEKLKKTISRVRKEIRNLNLPVQIQLKNNAFFLKRNCQWVCRKGVRSISKPAFTTSLAKSASKNNVKLNAQNELVAETSKWMVIYQALKSIFTKSEFCTRDVKKYFPWYSERSLSRILSELATNQKLQCHGWGAGRRYRLL